VNELVKIRLYGATIKKMKNKHLLC